MGRLVSPEERLAAVNAALAEAGYPDDAFLDVEGYIVVPLLVPPDVAWRAGAITPSMGHHPCFPCWEADHFRAGVASAACTHDTWEGAPPVRSRA